MSKVFSTEVAVKYGAYKLKAAIKAGKYTIELTSRIEQQVTSVAFADDIYGKNSETFKVGTTACTFKFDVTTTKDHAYIILTIGARQKATAYPMTIEVKSETESGSVSSGASAEITDLTEITHLFAITKEKFATITPNPNTAYMLVKDGKVEEIRIGSVKDLVKPSVDNSAKEDPAEKEGAKVGNDASVAHPADNGASVVPTDKAIITLGFWNIGHFTYKGNSYTTNRKYTDLSLIDADREEYRNTIQSLFGGKMPDVLGVCEWCDYFAASPVTPSKDYVLPEYQYMAKTAWKGYFYNAMLSTLPIAKTTEIKHVGTTEWPYGKGQANPQYRAFLVNEFVIKGKKIAMVVMHLEPTANSLQHFETFRKPQMEELAAWIKEAQTRYDGIVLMGDWNTTTNQIMERFKQYEENGVKKQYLGFGWGNPSGKVDEKHPYPIHNLGLQVAFGKASHNGVRNDKVQLPAKVNGVRKTSVTEEREPDISFIDNIMAWGCVKISNVEFKYTDVNTCDHPAIGCTLEIV